MTVTTPPIEKIVVSAIVEGTFNTYTEQLIADEIRNQPDDTSLTFVGFILAIAVELMDNYYDPIHKLSLRTAKKTAVATYHEFLSDNTPELEFFGRADYIWTKRAARQIAHDYQLEFWEVK